MIEQTKLYLSFVLKYVVFQCGGCWWFGQSLQHSWEDLVGQKGRSPGIGRMEEVFLRHAWNPYCHTRGHFPASKEGRKNGIFNTDITVIICNCYIQKNHKFYVNKCSAMQCAAKLFTNIASNCETELTWLSFILKLVPLPQDRKCQTSWKMLVLKNKRLIPEVPICDVS